MNWLIITFGIFFFPLALGYLSVNATFNLIDFLNTSTRDRDRSSLKNNSK